MDRQSHASTKVIRSPPTHCPGGETEARGTQSPPSPVWGCWSGNCLSGTADLGHSGDREEDKQAAPLGWGPNATLLPHRFCPQSSCRQTWEHRARGKAMAPGSPSLARPESSRLHIAGQVLGTKLPKANHPRVS